MLELSVPAVKGQIKIGQDTRGQTKISQIWLVLIFTSGGFVDCA